MQQARQRLDEKIAAAAAPIAAVAKKRELNDWIVDGRLERERLVEEAGGGGAAARIGVEAGYRSRDALDVSVTVERDRTDDASAPLGMTFRTRMRW